MKPYSFFLFVCIFFSCSGEENDKGGVAPPFPDMESPYDDPIWHPSEDIIGFNHTPVKEIHYHNGRQFSWVHDLDSIGFWLINPDGSNMRKVLPYYLNTPSWSPDGKWIAFSRQAQICIMPFDGEVFDTTAIINYDFPGRCFSPIWSRDGTKIAFVQSVCNDVMPCGIWVYSLETGDFDFIVRGTYPAWDIADTNCLFYIEDSSIIQMYNFQEDLSRQLLLLQAPNRDNRHLKCSVDGKTVAFISVLDNGEGMQLFKIKTDGSELTKLTSEGCTQFSWSPDSKRVVYVNFNERLIDKTVGSLWTMNFDGTEKKPLTYNRFKTVE